MSTLSTLFVLFFLPHTLPAAAPSDVLRILQNEDLSSGSTRAGCTTKYGGCNCGPCCQKFAEMGCSEGGYKNNANHGFFRENGQIYGTVAAGVPGSNVEWTTCGTCYEMTLGPNCSTIDYSSGHPQCTVAPSNWGCQSVNRNILGNAGTKVTVMVTNRCAECSTGHFDVCEDGLSGVGLQGMDNPTAAYKSVACPAALLKRMGCSGGDQCTPREGDPWSSGSEIKCCSGMKKCLRASAGWAYRCQSCGNSCSDDADYASRPCQ